ncbi:hypothetical protein JX266_011770 [Neoarthrinium moseri]|nr:hypothetical protein JX266_011770 [Neoarthrinium moseri]
MARTRSKGGATTTTKSASKSQSSAGTESRYTLPDESPNPPKIFILPRKATPEARVVSLLNPRYGKPTRYLVCPSTGVYEFTRIAAPKSTPRSWLIEHSTSSSTTSNSEPPSASQNEEKDKETTTTEKGQDEDEFGAYITKGAELFVATPVDPVFLVLPALSSSSAEEGGASNKKKKLFLSSDDHFDNLARGGQDALSPHLGEVLRWGNIRALFESRMAVVCDTVDAGDESMYRLSEDKLLAVLLDKARSMSTTSLPPSMEEKFVAKALEAPVLSVKRETPAAAPQASTETPASQSAVSTPKVENSESQSSVSSADTTLTTVSDASTAATSVAAAEEEAANSEAFELKPAIVASPEIISLQRLRTALSFILSSYVAPAQAARLREQLGARAELQAEFGPLDDYLGRVAALRQEAVAARSMADYSRKRVLDEEELAERAEKKRRKDEDDKRKKAGLSRGVKTLGKVNTSGMKKMSDFFKKK